MGRVREVRRVVGRKSNGTGIEEGSEKERVRGEEREQIRGGGGCRNLEIPSFLCFILYSYTLLCTMYILYIVLIYILYIFIGMHT